jgi:hypothetical protein
MTRSLREADTGVTSLTARCLDTLDPESVMPRRVRRLVRLLLLTAIVLALAACSAVAGIFKAGMWTGVLAIVVVIALIVWLFGRHRG